MASIQTNRRRWLVTTGAVILTSLVLAVGSWWWRSRGYISTDDARIKADMVSINSEMAGRIHELIKDEGDAVDPGEVMGRLVDQEIRLQILQAEAELDRARSLRLQTKKEIEFYLERQKGEMVKEEASLEGYRHNLEDARAHEGSTRVDWQRARELFDRKLIAAQNLDHAETDMRQAQARVSALKEKIKEAEANLELLRIRVREVAIKEGDLQAREAELRHAEARLADLKRKLNFMTIRSPVRGTVARKNAHQGEFIQPGQSIFMVVNSIRYWVEANIEETKIRFVKPGRKAVIRVDSYPGKDFFGQVVEIGAATVSEFSLFSPSKLTGVFIKSTQRLPVKIAVENTDGLLKVGMLAVVWIDKGEN